MPLGNDPEQRADAVARAETELRAEVERLIGHRAVFRPGRVPCLRCDGNDCDHGEPGPREVFAGWGPSGLPRFVDFGQWLLARQDPEVERLYVEGGAPVTVVVPGRELTADLLPAFRDAEVDYRIHGQVAAGWFVPPRRAADFDPRMALCLQVVSSAGRGRIRRLGLNLLGTGPGGEGLDEVRARWQAAPWVSPLQWAQGVLDGVERAQHDPEASPERLSARIEGILRSVANRLARDWRSGARRTGHATQRHQQGDRPTRLAHADLRRADDSDILMDRQRNTLVVLGDRGRVHIFNAIGKLVTSIRYSPEAIQRKRQRRWRQADEGPIRKLRAAISRAAP